MNKKAKKLNDKGIVFLEKGDFDRAQDYFQKAVSLDPSPPIINNLAMAKFKAGDAAGALKILSVNLEDEKVCSPFARGLAARILKVLGREEEAFKQVQEAISHFESGLSRLKCIGHVDDTWKEYTVIVIRAAADLGEHRLVLDLYKKWQRYHVSWENSYLAGIAAFNLNKFKQSASYWANIYEVSYASGLQQIAILVERGTIPPFKLEYEYISSELGEEIIKKKQESEQGFKECMKRGIIRMFLLMTALGEDTSEEMVNYILESLIFHGEDWGRQLGEGILKSSIVPFKVKFAAAKALVEAGVYNYNEPIPVFYDGKTQTVSITKFEITWEVDEETEKEYKLAVKLRDKGALDKAVKKLENIYEKEIFYPPAMMTLANLYRRKDSYDKALHIFELLEKICPEEPTFLFNFSAYWMDCSDFDKARDYIKRINPEVLNPAFIEKLEMLKQQIEFQDENFFPYSEAELFANIMESMRNKVENKPLSINSSLLRCLKNMPAEWLEGICDNWGIKPDRLRKDKEAQINKFFSQAENVQTVIDSLESEEIEVLKYLLEKGGWVRINVVSRKFGSMEGDGYYWNEEKPSSVLGTLWSKALVAVGTSKIAARRCRIVVIPLELRDMLEGC